MFDLYDHAFFSGHGVLPIGGGHADTLPDDYPPPLPQSKPSDLLLTVPGLDALPDDYPPPAPKPQPKPSDPPAVFTPPSTNTLPDDYPPQPPR